MFLSEQLLTKNNLIRLTSRFLCQEENHKNPAFLVATIVVGVMMG